MERRQEVFDLLERLRHEFACPDHPEGDISISYQARSTSYLLSCEEQPNGRCVFHYHFDPEDWKDQGEESVLRSTRR